MDQLSLKEVPAILNSHNHGSRSDWRTEEGDERYIYSCEYFALSAHHARDYATKYLQGRGQMKENEAEHPDDCEGCDYCRSPALAFADMTSDSHDDYQGPAMYNPHHYRTYRLVSGAFPNLSVTPSITRGLGYLLLEHQGREIILMLQDTWFCSVDYDDPDYETKVLAEINNWINQARAA